MDSPATGSVPMPAAHGETRGKVTSEEEDVVCRTIGDFGRWQLRMTSLLALLTVPCTLHISADTFQGATVDYWCARPAALSNLSVDVWKNISEPYTIDEDGEITFNACNVWDVNYTALAALTSASWEAMQALIPRNKTRECSSWEFDHSMFSSTTSEEWNLVCGNSWLEEFSELTYLVGVAIGGLFSGICSERFGRRKTLIISVTTQFVVGTAIAFNPWFWVFCLLRFILGFISVGIVLTGFVLCMEQVGGRWRTISGVCYQMPVSVSYIILACIAYFIRDWRMLQLAVSIPGLLCVVILWVVPESPRWLLAVGRREEVAAILQRAARVNRLPTPPDLDKQLEQEILPDSDNSASVLDLFKTPNIRRYSLLLYILWFADYLAYYGLQLNINDLGGNVYFNTILSGVVELPAVALSVLFLLRMGRRWPLSLTLSAGGVAGLLSFLLPSATSTWVTVALAMLGKFCVSSSNAVLPVFTAELFPTVLRNQGVGACNVPAGAALGLVPYLWLTASYGEAVPMGILGSVSLGAGLTALLLPETANRSLPQTIEEAEHKDRSLRRRRGSVKQISK